MFVCDHLRTHHMPIDTFLDKLEHELIPFFKNINSSLLQLQACQRVFTSPSKATISMSKFVIPINYLCKSLFFLLGERQTPLHKYVGIV